MPPHAAIFLFVAATSAPALAAAESADFAALDADNNGNLDRTELVRAGLFQRLDANGDAYLQLDEFAGMAHLHRDWDHDGDMRLSEDEFHWAGFRAADTDGDGLLSEQEYLRLLELLGVSAAE